MSIKKIKDREWSFRFKINGVERRRKGFVTKQEAMQAEDECRKELMQYGNSEKDLTKIYAMLVNKK